MEEHNHITETADLDNRIDDTTLESDESINIIEKYLQIYNIKHESNGSMFDNVDIKNPVDTNDQMETFYEYMSVHNYLYHENHDYVDVYEPGHVIEGSDENDTYALVMGKDSKIKYISLSYISLLTIGVRYPKDIGKDWSIVLL
jgi:hypothetical protein